MARAPQAVNARSENLIEGVLGMWNKFGGKDKLPHFTRHTSDRVTPLAGLYKCAVIYNTSVFPKYDTFLRPVAPRLSTICLLAAVYIPYIKQMSCVALPLFGLPPVCPQVHSLGYVGDA